MLLTPPPAPVWGARPDGSVRAVVLWLAMPPEWVGDGSVLLDARGRKVAELAPGVFELGPGGYGCTDYAMFVGAYTLALREIRFVEPPLPGTRVLSEVYSNPWQGSAGWVHEYAYCVTLGGLALRLTFYARPDEHLPEAEERFDRVVGSARLVEVPPPGAP